MGSFSDLIAGLTRGRQHRRILRIAFPNNDGPDAVLLANRLEGREELSRDFEFEVEVLADDAQLALKDVQGKLVTIELVRGDGSLRFFNGYVFAFRLIKTDGSVAFYSMTLKPWLAYLKLRTDNFLFHDMSLREQTKSIFDDYGIGLAWDLQLEGPDLPMTMACQFDEDDHNYLHRRWEAAGWVYWYSTPIAATSSLSPTIQRMPVRSMDWGRKYASKVMAARWRKTGLVNGRQRAN